MTFAFGVVLVLCGFAVGLFIGAVVCCAAALADEQERR